MESNTIDEVLRDEDLLEPQLKEETMKVTLSSPKSQKSGIKSPKQSDKPFKHKILTIEHEEELEIGGNQKVIPKPKAKKIVNKKLPGSPTLTKILDTNKTIFEITKSAGRMTNQKVKINQSDSDSEVSEV